MSTEPEKKETGESQAPAPAGDAPSGAYETKQWAFIGFMFLTLGILGVVGNLRIVEGLAALSSQTYLLFWGLGTLFIEVRDLGDALLVATGPLRWCFCGLGKEKIKYDEIVDFGVTKTCVFGFGLGQYLTPLKLFNSCNCMCLGDSCCGQTTIRVAIKERPQALGAGDESDCCCEACCMRTFCGEGGKFWGSGCYCSFCNPCGANCCMTNSFYISTNDPDGLMALLKEKTSKDETVLV